MERKPVKSSNIISVGYLEEAEILEIEFENGIYLYNGVSKNTYDNLMSASSKGRYVFDFIKAKYPTTRVK